MFEFEEWVGAHWHRFITRYASATFPEAAVSLDQVKKSVGILFRANGGANGKRIEAASARDYLLRQNLLQKIAGNQAQVSVAWSDKESLRLPEQLAVYPDSRLNRDLYLWLALLAASFENINHCQFSHWGRDNQGMVQHLLQTYPALNQRYQHLVEQLLPFRPDIKQLHPSEAALEQAIQNALINPGSVYEFPRSNRAPQPVPLWLYPSCDMNKVQDYKSLPDAEQDEGLVTT